MRLRSRYQAEPLSGNGLVRLQSHIQSGSAKSRAIASNSKRSATLGLSAGSGLGWHFGHPTRPKPHTNIDVVDEVVLDVNMFGPGMKTIVLCQCDG